MPVRCRVLAARLEGCICLPVEPTAKGGFTRPAILLDFSSGLSQFKGSIDKILRAHQVVRIPVF